MNYFTSFERRVNRRSAYNPSALPVTLKVDDELHDEIRGGKPHVFA